MAWKVLNLVAMLVFLAVLGLVGGEQLNDTDSNSRSLKGFELVGLYEGCPQGKQGINTWETMHNHHDWWENNWGRSDASWPRRGFQSCWDNRGDVCQLPDQDHVVCLPGSRRGSTVNKGWALDPKAQGCRPGVHCLYACEPGYYWTTFNDGETSNYDVVHGPKVGHCDGTWDYGTSTHGVYCKEDGQLAMPQQPLCMQGETYVYAENRLDTHVFLCQTVFPGHEIFLIPTLVKPGETVMITTQPKHFWSGPTYSSPTHGDIYVGFAGADIMESCTWDEISPSGASLLPYEIGSGVEDNGVVYSTHYYYQQPNSEVPANMVGYELDLECESSEWGVCGGVFRNADVVKVDVLKKPSPGTTSVKFVFNPPHMKPKFEGMYKDPNRNYLTDPHMISSMKYFDMYDPSGHGGSGEPSNGGGYHTHTANQWGGDQSTNQWGYDYGRKLKNVDSSPLAEYLAGKGPPRMFPSPIENFKWQMAHLENGTPLPRGATRLGQAVSLPRERVNDYQAEASKYGRPPEEKKDRTKAVECLGSSVRNMSVGDRALIYHPTAYTTHSQTHSALRSNSFHTS